DQICSGKAVAPPACEGEKTCTRCDKPGKASAGERARYRNRRGSDRTSVAGTDCRTRRARSVTWGVVVAGRVQSGIDLEVGGIFREIHETNAKARSIDGQRQRRSAIRGTILTAVRPNVPEATVKPIKGTRGGVVPDTGGERGRSTRRRGRRIRS